MHSSKVKVVTTKYKIFLSEWDPVRERVILYTGSDKRNSYLRQVDDWLQSTYLQYEEVVERLRAEGLFTVQDIAGGFLVERYTNTLARFTGKLSRELIRAGRDRTSEVYIMTCKKFIKFNDGKDIPFKHINACLIKKFETDMKVRGRSLNTIAFYMRNLRAIYNKAVLEKWVEHKDAHLFSGVCTSYQRTIKKALTLEELKALLRLARLPKFTQMESELHKSWRYFFFCFYARGMSFVDMAYLRKENLNKGVLSYYRKKTGQFVEVKVLPELQRIIDGFAPEVAHTAYLLPVIVDPKLPPRKQYLTALRIQNMRLKELGQLARLRHPLSTHVSRHSWATIAKANKFPVWVISEGLGHASERTTYNYLAAFDRPVIDNVNDIVCGMLTDTTLPNDLFQNDSEGKAPLTNY